MRAVHPCITVFAVQLCADSAKHLVLLAADLAVQQLR